MRIRSFVLPVCQRLRAVAASRMMASMYWPARAVVLLGLFSALAAPIAVRADSLTEPPGQVVTIIIPPAPSPPPPPPAPPPPAPAPAPPPPSPAPPPAAPEPPAAVTPPPPRLRPAPPRGGPSVEIVVARGGRTLPRVPRSRRSSPLPQLSTVGGSGLRSRIRAAPRWLLVSAAVLIVAEFLFLTGFAYRRWVRPRFRRPARR